MYSITEYYSVILFSKEIKNMKKRILTLIIGVVLMLALTACGQKNSEAPAATEAPIVTTAPAVNEDITETVEPTVAPTEAPVIEEPTDVEEVVPTEAPVIEDVEEPVPTEAPVIEEPVVEPTDVPEIEEPVPTEAPVVVEPTDVPVIEEPVVEPTESPIIIWTPTEETTSDTNKNTDSETNEDAYHNSSFVPQTGKAQDTEATVLTKEEADALEKAEEERRAKIKSFPLEVTYMHDCGRNREFGIEPELRTVTFETFASGEESSTDLCYTIMNEQNPARKSFDDVKVLVDALDPAYVEAKCNQDLMILGFNTPADLLKYVNQYGFFDFRYDDDYNRVETRLTDEFYVYSLVELSSDNEFIWGIQFVTEDVADPSVKTTHSFLFWDYYYTLIDNPAYY